MCLLREAFHVCVFLLLGGNAEFLFRGEPLRQGELKHFNHIHLGVFSDRQLKLPL